MPDYTELKGFSSAYYEMDLATQIEANLISFFDWGFINAGAFTNVRIPQSGAYGGDFSKLRAVRDPRYTDNTVFEAVRGNWIWESGLSFGTPIQLSGVWVNNVLQVSGFTVDYPRGRIFFNTPQTGNVQVEYSYKEISFLPANEDPLRGQGFSRRPDSADFYSTSGLYFSLSDQKVNLPCVTVELIGRSNRPYQLGGGQYVTYEAQFHVLGEDKGSVSKITDIICNQNEKTIYMFDLDRLFSEDAAPLKIDGSLNTNPKSYPQLVETSGDGGYRAENVQWGKLRMSDAKSQNMQPIGTNLYRSTATMDIEIVTQRI